MNTAVIYRLLCLLDVRMHALALCKVSRGMRLKLPAGEDGGVKKNMREMNADRPTTPLKGLA